MGYHIILKKIILTTDQDLIKDDVQTIDDDFLEWFVKNPSYEVVLITNDFEQVNQDNPILLGSTSLVRKYKITMLEEENKKEMEKKQNTDKKFTEEEVELIANEMVNWAIDNIGNPNPQSGKKFDEVLNKYKK